MDTTPHQSIILPRLCSGTVLTVRFTLTAVLFNGTLSVLRASRKILRFSDFETLSWFHHL